MEGVATRLNHCLIEYDETSAREHRDRWNKLNQTARLTPDDELFQKAQEPLQWLTELDEEANAENEFSLAVGELEVAVDQQVSIDELDRKIYEAQKFERELPETLVHRVNSYRDGLQVNHRRKTWLKVAAGTAILATSITAIAWFISLRSQQNKIANARNQLTQFVADAGYDPGRNFFDGLPESFKNDGEIIRSFDQLVADEQQEKNRSAKYDELIDLIDLTGPLEIDLNNFLKEAKQISVNETEQNQVEVLENRLLSERLIRQNNRNTEFLKKLDPHKESLEELLKAEVQLNTIEQLKEVMGNVDNLVFASTKNVDGMAGISSSIRRNADNLINKAGAKIREIEVSNQAFRSLKKLKAQLGSTQQYASAIKSFASRFPDDPNTQDFLSSVNEKDHWNSFERWASLASEMDAVELEKITASDATKLLEKITQANQSSLKQPDASIQLLVKFLSQRTTLPENGQSFVVRLRSVFEQSLFTSIEVVKRDGRFYYLALSFTPGNDTKFKYFAKDGATKSTNKTKADNVITAPHCEISKHLTAQLSQDVITDYEQLIIELIELTLGKTLKAESAEKVDALVQCEFLDQILLFAIKTSPQLKKFAEEQRAEMQTKKLIGGDWKARVESNYDLRKIAKLFITNFAKDFDSAKREVQPTENDFAEMTQWKTIKNYSTVGFLYRTKSKWLVETNSELETDTNLYCLIPDADGSAEFETIGVFKSNAFEVQSDSPLQAGRPVFAISPEK